MHVETRFSSLMTYHIFKRMGIILINIISHLPEKTRELFPVLDIRWFQLLVILYSLYKCFVYFDLRLCCLDKRYFIIFPSYVKNVRSSIMVQNFSSKTLVSLILTSLLIFRFFRSNNQRYKP